MPREVGASSTPPLLDFLSQALWNTGSTRPFCPRVTTIRKAEPPPANPVFKLCNAVPFRAGIASMARSERHCVEPLRASNPTEAYVISTGGELQSPEEIRRRTHLQ